MMKRVDSEYLAQAERALHKLPDVMIERDELRALLDEVIALTTYDTTLPENDPEKLLAAIQRICIKAPKE